MHTRIAIVKMTRFPIVLTLGIVTVCLTTGCRSGKNPLKMFARRGEPSAEALAGTGPTTTYPAPPSLSATPEAIASVAGGTANRSSDPITPSITPGTPTSSTAIASTSPQPGYATPASANMSAAQANGFYGSSQSAGYSGSAKTMPSGYQFGKKTFTPKQDATAPSASENIAGSTTSSGAANSVPNYTAPSSFTPPSLTASNTSTSSSAGHSQGDSQPAGGGFTLPGGFSPDAIKSNATAAIGNVAEATSNAASTAMESVGNTADAAKAEAQTASAAVLPTAAATPSPNYTPAASGANSGGGYMPGSIQGAKGYPSSGYPSEKSGSFYR